MKSKVQHIIIFAIAFFLSGISAFAQTGSKKSYVPYGGTFTPKGRLDVLIVYAGFSNDMNPASPIYNHKEWPAEQEFPNYADEIFYPDSSYLVSKFSAYSLYIRNTISFKSAAQIFPVKDAEVR